MKASPRPPICGLPCSQPKARRRARPARWIRRSLLGIIALWPAVLPADYAQDFNSLPSSGGNTTWTNNSTLPGWYSNETNLRIGTGSNTPGGLWSFGSTVLNPTDRALGSLASNSADPVIYGLALVNASGSAINSVTISYTGEEWRDASTAAQTLAFEYVILSSFNPATFSITANAYTAAAALNYTSSSNLAAALGGTGNTVGFRSSVSATLNITIPAGQYLVIRWRDIDDAGNDDGLAVDDLSVQANGLIGVPEPSTWAAGALVLGALGWHQRRRLAGLRPRA